MNRTSRKHLQFLKLSYFVKVLSLKFACKFAEVVLKLSLCYIIPHYTLYLTLQQRPLQAKTPNNLLSFCKTETALKTCPNCRRSCSAARDKVRMLLSLFLHSALALSLSPLSPSLSFALSCL